MTRQVELLRGVNKLSNILQQNAYDTHWKSSDFLKTIEKFSNSMYFLK